MSHCEHKRYSIHRRYRFDLMSPVERANVTGDTAVPVETQKVCDECGELWTQVDSEPPKRDTIPCPPPVHSDPEAHFDRAFDRIRKWPWFRLLTPHEKALIKDVFHWAWSSGGMIEMVKHARGEP
jgi:hypothetical protein